MIIEAQGWCRLTILFNIPLKHHVYTTIKSNIHETLFHVVSTKYLTSWDFAYPTSEID
jgi:hypothetical protein